MEIYVQLPSIHQVRGSGQRTGLSLDGISEAVEVREPFWTG